MSRTTTIKDQLLKIIETTLHPISALEIQKKCPNINRATIYRTLDSLKKKQLIRIVEIGDGIVHYESINNHHHHLICLKCKKMERVELPSQEEKHLQKLQDKFQIKSKFTSLQHSLEFFGLCAKCK